VVGDNVFVATPQAENNCNKKAVLSQGLTRDAAARSSKVIDFVTNQKRVCDFLLGRHSNLGHILHRFRYIAGFLPRSWPHPYITLILGVFPLDQIARVGVDTIGTFCCSAVKLFSKYSNLCEKHTSKSQTDRRTDDIQSHNRALRSIAR